MLNKCSRHVQIQFGVNLEPEHLMKKRSIDQPLRIHLVYDASLHRLPNDQQRLIKVCVAVMCVCVCVCVFIHVSSLHVYPSIDTFIVA